jgi:hypothetical protein
MDSSGHRWPREDLRVGDADRQRVVAELQRHFIDGRLTSEELGERVSEALKARTFGDLAMPLQDLPALGDGQRPEAPVPMHEHEHSWHERMFAPPLGAAMILIGVLALLWLLVFPSTHFAVMPFWPILIWGFFFVGRPRRGGPRRF